MAAFAAARKAFDANPQPGTPAWDHWQELCKEAMRANDEYIRALAATTHPPTLNRDRGPSP
jgi:hypothetical protein